MLGIKSDIEIETGPVALDIDIYENDNNSGYFQ